MGFDIMSLQKGRGTVQARSKADEGRAVLKYIDVEDLVPSEDNFYSMSNIEELAGLIELSGGVKQPGLVVPLGGGKYKLLSGHRRRLASLQLVKQGKEAYRKMPCMVEDAGREQGPEADELRAIDEAILLITTNGQREKTGKDKVVEDVKSRATRTKEYIMKARKIIAEWMGTTPAQVGRYDSIAKHLIPAFKTWLEEEKINISVAYELSTMSEREQLTALDRARAIGRGPSIDEVKRLREELRTPEPPKAERTEPKPAEDGQEYKPGAYVRTEPTKMTTVPPDGKIVDFPAPVSPPPVEDAPPEETGREQEKDIEWAALMLKTLRNYCETMAAVKGGQTVPWAEYAEAVGIAIAALRK